MMKHQSEIFYKLMDKERNIYEVAELFEQQRRSVDEYLENLASFADGKSSFRLENNQLVCTKTQKSYPIHQNVIDFTEVSKNSEEWQRLNQQFLNYHRSLSPYTLLNSTPTINYVSLKSGLGLIQNAKVIDVGGGTGHTLCSFFQFPETIEYYLLDPNLRLLHDQFIRIYPKLSWLKMAHLLAYAEKLPFKSDFADVVMSFSSIDHFQSYQDFIKDSYRVLKPKGKLLISSHLDNASDRGQITPTRNKIFSHSFWERIARYLYFRKHKIGKDDHTFHFETHEPIEKAMKDAGFQITISERFKGNFLLVGEK